MERDPLACVIHHWKRDVWWSVCGHTPQLVVPPLSPATLRRTNREPWIALESFIIEINPSARHKWEDNIIITPQANCFYFSICLLSFRQAAAIWCIVYVYVLVGVCWCVCVCTWKGASAAQKIPLRGICIGLLCYSRLSGTLVPTYLSMSEQAAENKLICFSFYPPSSLSSPSFTCFLPSLSLHISLCLHASFSLSISPLFSCLCYCKMQHSSSSFFPSFSFLLFTPWKSELISYLRIWSGFFWVGQKFQSSMLRCQSRELCKNGGRKKSCFRINFPPLSNVLNSSTKSNPTQQQRQINK